MSMTYRRRICLIIILTLCFWLKQPGWRKLESIWSFFWKKFKYTVTLGYCEKKGRSDQKKRSEIWTIRTSPMLHLFIPNAALFIPNAAFVHPQKMYFFATHMKLDWRKNLTMLLGFWWNCKTKFGRTSRILRTVSGLCKKHPYVAFFCIFSTKFCCFFLINRKILL